MGARKRKTTSQAKKSSVNNSIDINIYDNRNDVSGDDAQQWKALATLLGAFLFSCMCTALIWYVYIRDRTALEYVTIRSVDVLTLSSPEASFVEDVVAAGRPVIIKNSLVNKWPARSKWTPDYFIKKQKQLSGIYENTNRWFGPYYQPDKPMGVFTERVNNYRTNLTLTTKEFVNRISGGQWSKGYIYYTSEIERLGDWALRDIVPYEDLLSPNPAHSSINVWIGQPSVIAHCHYDGYNNFYAQLYGRKRFVLFSPRSYKGLYPYPFLHPSHAQAQVNLSGFDIDSFPRVKDLVSYEANLAPGDVLYIPPLWYHHVEAVDVSVSVNVWTDTVQSVVMEQVFNIDTPIDSIQWNGDHLKAIGSSVILSTLVKSVCKRMKCDAIPAGGGDIAAADIVHRLWDSRYRVLMDTNVLKSNFTSAHRKSLLCENGSLPSLFFKGIAQKFEQVSIKKYSEAVAKLIATLPADTWETWFGNYVEYIAYKAVALSDIGVFLKNYDSCLKHF